MDLFDLVAKLKLDKSEFEADINNVQGNIGSKLGTAAKVGVAAIGAVTGAVGAFSVASVKTGMDFDSAMSQVAATMGKPKSEIKDLSEFAKQMGATTSFSATQAAEALNYMALAGYDSETSMKMLPKVLNLAAAGNMDLATASDMVTDASSALGLTMDETETLVDQMAKTSSKTNTSVGQLGEGILTIGATARGVKGGTKELTQVLGILADNGIKGAEGGTHLRNAILSLQTPTKAGTEALEQLGMTYDDFYDSAGNMKSLPEIFQTLNEKMAGMNQQSKDAIISGIFNKTDLAAINALIGTTSERWEEVGTAIDGAKGSAKEMADTQLDNLNGDITLMKSAFEGVQIAVSDGLTPILRKLVQGASKGLSEITTKITEYLAKEETQKKLNKIADAAEKLINLILDNLDKIFELGINVITGIMDAIGFLIEHIDTVKTVIGMVLAAWGAIKAANIVTSIAGVVGVIGKIVTAAGGIIPVVMSLINPVTLVVAAVAAAAVAIIMNWDKIKEAWGKAVEFFKGVWKGITEAFSKVKEWISDVFKKAWEGVKSAWSGAKKFFSDRWNDIKSAFNGGVEKMKTIGGNLATGLKNGITGMKQKISEAAGGAWSAIKNAFSNSVEGMKTIGTNITTGLRNGISGAASKVGEIGRKVFEIVTNVFKNAPEALKRIGKNLMVGLYNGIVEKAQAVIDKVKGVAESMIGFAKKILGISSPSKVFAQFGANLMQGMANGIEGNLGLVEDAMGDMTDMLYSEAPSSDVMSEYATTYGDGGFVTVPRQAEQKQLTVVLELDRMVLGRAVYNLNNEESQRVGVRLAGGYA